jgi:hypothetical protein
MSENLFISYQVVLEPLSTHRMQQVAHRHHPRPPGAARAIVPDLSAARSL